MKSRFLQTRTLALVAALVAGLFVLVAGHWWAAPAAAQIDCSPTNAADCQALVDLYNSAGGDAWSNKENWLQGSPCDASSGWFGVTCEDDGGEQRVTGIDLSNNGLAGPLPASVLNMERLASLILTGNRLSGPIPEVTRTDSPLVDLYLTRNAFEGEIPASLSALTNLQFLYLNGNILRGAVPASLCSLTPVASAAEGNFSLDFNALAIDERESDACLDAQRGSDWRDTQTVPPNPRVGDVTVQAANGNLVVSWQPIAYQGGGGFYEALISNSSGFYEIYEGIPADAHPEHFKRRTNDKSGDSVTFDKLENGTTYYIVVRTQTNANPEENSPNQNIVLSDFSQEISTQPVAVSLADFRAAPGQGGPAWGGVLALLLALASGGLLFLLRRPAR